MVILTNEKRIAICRWYRMEETRGGPLGYGRAAAASREFHVSTRTIQKIIKRFKEDGLDMQLEDPFVAVLSRRIGVASRPSQLTPEVQHGW